MEDHMQYIDDFFQGKFSPEEVKVFEEKITNDPSFAANVAFYLSAKQSARDMVDEEKKKRYKDLYSATNGHQNKDQPAKVRRMYYVSRVALVAAIVAAIVVTVFNWNSDSPQKLANQYINNNYKDLSVTMGKETDLQRAADLYNVGKYKEALAAFQELIRQDNSSFQAVQYAGISALRIPDYDKALQYFRDLENFRAQFANPAVLLQAVTFLKRNQEGDKRQAKSLLQRVINENLDGKPTAEKLLKEW